MRFFLTAMFALVLWPSAGHALDCAMPVFDDAAIDKAELIFEGTVTGEDKTSLPGGMTGKASIRNFEFHIDRLWKGDVTGDAVKVAMDTYWGDGFVMGKQYLVVADKETLGYQSHLCGTTTYLENGLASQPEKLETLKHKFPDVIR
jgi:hypothetical protein